MADEAVVKSAWAIDWSDVATAEATLLERCAAGGASHMDLPDCHQPSAQSPTLALGALPRPTISLDSLLRAGE